MSRISPRLSTKRLLPAIRRLVQPCLCWYKSMAWHSGSLRSTSKSGSWAGL